MNKLPMIYSGFFCVFVMPVLASANCGLRVNASSVAISWNQNFTYQAVTFTVTKTQAGQCTAYVTFNKGGAPDYASRKLTYLSSSLSYQLYKESALTHILKDVPDTTSLNDVITLSFPSTANSTLTGTYYVQITNPATVLPAGTYVNTFDMKAFDGSSLTPDSTASVNLSATIPRMIDLSIVGTGQSFDVAATQRTLNFGTLTTGLSLGLDLLIRSNVGYSVSFSSQNNGALKNANTQINTPISYSLLVDQILKDLSGSAASPSVVASGTGQTQDSGHRHTLEFRVGDTHQSMAGNYSDYITVTATSNE